MRQHAIVVSLVPLAFKVVYFYALISIWWCRLQTDSKSNAKICNGSYFEKCEGSPFELFCALWWLDEASEAGLPDLQDKQRSGNSLERTNYFKGLHFKNKIYRKMLLLLDLTFFKIHKINEQLVFQLWRKCATMFAISLPTYNIILRPK